MITHLPLSLVFFQINEISNSSVKNRLVIFYGNRDTEKKDFWTLDFSWDSAPEYAAFTWQEKTQQNDSKKAHRGRSRRVLFWLEPIFLLVQGGEADKQNPYAFP